MTTYRITTDVGSPPGPSFYSFEEIAALSLVSSDKAILVNDITFRGLTDGNVITLGTDTIFEGNNKTIYMSDSTKERGFFTIEGGTIQNLTVDFAGKTYSSRRSMLLNQDPTNDTVEYGTFNHINLINGTRANSTGVIGFRMGNASNPVTYNKIYSNITRGSNDAGTLGYIVNNFVANDCHFINSGPIIGYTQIPHGTQNQINRCYVSGNLNSFQLIFNVSGQGIDVTNSYFIADQSGIINQINNSGQGLNQTVTFTNCYFNLNVEFINNIDPTYILTLNNCYISSPNSSLGIDFITDDNDGTININDSYFKNPEQNQIASGTGTVNISGGNTQDISVIEGVTSLPNWNFSTVWTQGTGDNDAPAYPILRNFQDSTVWDGTYSNYLDQPTLRTGQSSGDPHVFTLTKQYYDYEYCGFSRFFDSGVDDPNRLLINCEIEDSDNKRWSHMSYYSKLYIKYKNSELLIDMGYRGRPIRILKKWIKDDDFKFEMKEEGFAKKVHLISQHCMNCDYTTKCDDDADQHVMDNCHTLLPLVRNSIKFNIPNYYLKLENVSCYNRQPGRVFFSTRKKEYNKYSGIVVDKKWKEISRIMHMFDIKSLNDKNEVDENNMDRYTIL